MRILHFADVHLDRPFIGMGLEAARKRRAGLRLAFDRCLDLARDRDADLITIGGDLWEDEHVTSDTIRWVADRLTRFGRPVVVVAGNHDPLSPGGPFDRATWGENVTVLAGDDGLTRVDVDELTIWGMSWRRSVPLVSAALKRFRVPEAGRRNVLLLHGTCGAVFGDQQSHCPFTSDDVRRAGFDVCLAGHLHAAGVRDDLVVYPGSPEPLSWSESGRHTAAIVDLPAAGDAVIDLVDVNTARYAVRRVDVNGAESSADIEREALALLVDIGDPGGLHLRVELEGRLAPGCDASDPAIAETLRTSGLASVDVRDRTRPAFDLDALADGTGVRAAFVRRMRERIATDGEVAEVALDLGLRALEGEVL
jgi:DNA repair exonuclease SbcCD nuclease subunit